MTTTAGTRIQTAHADAFAVSGRLREADGGGAAELPGVRLMSSGLPVSYLNAGDLTDAAQVDLDAVREWFAARGPDGAGVPWGLHVPAGSPWGHGRHVATKRLMAATGPDLRPAAAVAGLTLREAGPDDLDVVDRVSVDGFAEPRHPARAWMRPYLSAPGMLVLLASLDGEIVGTATGLRSDGDAGPCVEVSGVTVLAHARRRGIGSALTSAVTTWGFASGADLAWLGTEGDDAARVYEKLGYAETPGLDIYVDV